MQWILVLVVALPLCLADGAKAECCDICEQLTDPESSFYQNCDHAWQTVMKNKLIKDCNRIRDSGNDQQLSVFLTNIKEVCFVKTRQVVIFECPPEPCEPECVPDCDLCEEIRNISPCSDSLHELMIAKMIKDCKRMSMLCDSGDCTQLNAFWENLGEVCLEKVDEYEAPSCPPCEEETCDVSEEIGSTLCGAALNPILLRKVQKDCKRISALGGAQLDVFWENWAEICVFKGHEFEKPECTTEPEICDVCEEIGSTPCGAALNPILLRKVQKDCKRISALGGDQLGVFWENWAEICAFKEYEFEAPECTSECDECAMIAETECGASFHPIFFIKVLKDCDRIKKIGGEFYEVFWANLKEICMTKAKDFDRPNCDECNECRLILGTECVSSFNTIMQKKVRKDCDRIKAMGETHFTVFVENLAEICTEKGLGFEAPVCEEEACEEPDPCCIGKCDLCAELRDPLSDFGQTCRGLAPSDAELDALVSECMANMGDPAELSAFATDLVNACYESTGSFIEFCRFVPCGPAPVCVAKELDLIFLVDGSRSIGGENFKKVRDFVGSVISGFEISGEATRVGIITFSEVVKEHVLLGSVNTQAGLLSQVPHIPYDGLITNTHLGIDAAKEMFQSHGFGGRVKVLILVTDGKSTHPMLTYPSMFWFREQHPDTEVLVVGIDNLGTADTDILDPAELRAMATGLGNDNVFDVSGFDGLNDAVSALTTKACDANPSSHVRGPTSIPDPSDPSSSIDVQCQEVLYMYFIPPASETRFLIHYGVYELQPEFFCQDTFTYQHTSGDYNMWRDFSNFGVVSGSVGAVWQITTTECDTSSLFAFMMNDDADPEPLTYDLASALPTTKFWKDFDGVNGAATVCF